MQTLVSHSALGSAPLEQPASAQRMHPCDPPADEWT